MRKITITSANGSILEISRSKPYILQKLEGLGVPDNDTERLKSPNQDGTSYVQTLLESRYLDLEFAAFDQSQSDLFALRQYINKVMNPKYLLDILYEYPGGSKRITGHLDGELKFKKSDDRKVQEMVLSVECNDPFWRDASDSRATLTLEDPAFIFPLVFSPTIKFGVIANKTVVIENEGHVESPVLIKFLGPATNPIITNETTGEYIKVDKTLLADEMLEINTAFGNKSVMFGEYEEYIGDEGQIEYRFVGTPSNAFGFIDPESTFFQLQVGTNTIVFDDDTSSEDAKVVIDYNNLYAGV